MRLGGFPRDQAAQEHRHTRKSVSGGALGLFLITNSLFAFRNFPCWFGNFPIWPEQGKAFRQIRPCVKFFPFFFAPRGAGGNTL